MNRDHDVPYKALQSSFVQGASQSHAPSAGLAPNFWRARGWEVQPRTTSGARALAPKQRRSRGQSRGCTVRSLFCELALTARRTRKVNLGRTHCETARGVSRILNSPPTQIILPIPEPARGWGRAHRGEVGCRDVSGSQTIHSMCVW